MLVHKIIFVRLEHLTLKGLTFKSPDVFSLIIQQVPNVTVLTFYHNIEDIQQNRVPAREPINEEKLEKLLQKKCLQHLRELTITGINMEFGPIFLTQQRKGLLTFQYNLSPGNVSSNLSLKVCRLYKLSFSPHSPGKVDMK